jgi:hypothetical protein
MEFFSFRFDLKKLNLFTFLAYKWFFNAQNYCNWKWFRWFICFFFYGKSRLGCYLNVELSFTGRPLMQVSVNLYPEEIRSNIYNCKPGMTGIGSLIFRDEEKMISDAPDPKAMYARIYPYKGALEMWYQKNASLCTDFRIIFLTAWSIVFPKNQLVYKFFKDLPIRNF